MAGVVQRVLNSCAAIVMQLFPSCSCFLASVAVELWVLIIPPEPPKFALQLEDKYLVNGLIIWHPSYPFEDN